MFREQRTLLAILTFDKALHFTPVAMRYWLNVYRADFVYTVLRFYTAWANSGQLITFDIKNVEPLMDELVIRSDREFSLKFHSKKYGNDRWLDSYIVDACARNFRASFIVENCREGSSPNVLFEDMASNSGGWTDTKGWGALEGEFELSASMDSTGHVTLNLERDGNWEVPSWSCTFSLMIESGQLEAIASDANVFFSTQDFFLQCEK